MATITRDDIDTYMHDVRMQAAGYYGVSQADRVLDPLTYYIYTGRASAEALSKLIAQPRKTRRALICKLAHAGTIDAGLDAIRSIVH